MKKKSCCFSEMCQKLQAEARLFLTESVLVLKGVSICPKEIEVYYYEKGALRTILSIKMTYKGITKITSMCIDVEQSRQIHIKVVIMPESILL